MNHSVILDSPGPRVRLKDALKEIRVAEDYSRKLRSPCANVIRGNGRFVERSVPRRRTSRRDFRWLPERWLLRRASHFRASPSETSKNDNHLSKETSGEDDAPNCRRKTSRGNDLSRALTSPRLPGLSGVWLSGPVAVVTHPWAWRVLRRDGL